MGTVDVTEAYAHAPRASRAPTAHLHCRARRVRTDKRVRTAGEQQAPQEHADASAQLDGRVAIVRQSSRAGRINLL